MQFGSVCSGIEAATVAWHELGWRAAWLAEIDKFASALLAHHYPAVPNLGDMTKIARGILTGEVPAPDVLCGGTPCQAFSVAGLRESLADARGNLTLKFVEIGNAIDHVRAGRGEDECIVFWENVPGVLSTKDNAFGCFLAGLAGEDGPLEPPGGKWANAGAVYGPRRAVAWRTLDAQYFGVAQRRRRVFVVASARKGFDPAQVLFEWDGVRRDTAPSREARQVAPTIPARSTAGGGLGTDFDCDGGVIQVCPTLRAGGNRTGGDRPPGTDVDTADSLIPVAYGGNNQSGPIDVATARNACASASGRMDFETETFLVAPVATAIRTANTSANGHGISDELAHTLDGAQGQCVAFDTTHTLRGEGFDASEDGTGRGTPLAPVGVDHYNGTITGEVAATLSTGGATTTGSGPSVMIPVAFHPTQDPISSTDGTTHCMGTGSSQGSATIAVAVQASQSGVRFNETVGTLDANYGSRRHNGVMHGMQVRRLTPTEAERLQGFPDGYTAIPWRGKPADQCPDGPRYKALGNSWAVPNVTWLGRRIQAALRNS